MSEKKSGNNQSILEGKIRGNPDIYHSWCANNKQTVVFNRFAKPAINREGDRYCSFSSGDICGRSSINCCSVFCFFSVSATVCRQARYGVL